MYRSTAYKLSKVELGAIDDIRSAMDRAFRARTDASGATGEASRKAREAQKLYAKAIQVAEEAEKFLKEASKKGFPMAGADTKVAQMKKEAIDAENEMASFVRVLEKL